MLTCQKNRKICRDVAVVCARIRMAGCGSRNVHCNGRYDVESGKSKAS